MRTTCIAALVSLILVACGGEDPAAPLPMPTRNYVDHDSGVLHYDGGDLCDADSDGHKSIKCGGDDCDDDDARVFPGQKLYFDEPRPNGSYDYDCDGRQVVLGGDDATSCVAVGTCHESAFNKAGSSWATTVPPCGALGGIFGGCDADCHVIITKQERQQCH